MIDENSPQAFNCVFDPPEKPMQAIGHPVDRPSHIRLDRVRNIHCAAKNFSLEVPPRALKSFRGLRSLNSHVFKTKFQKCLVEFFGGDLPLGHRVFEVPNECTVFTHRFLEATRRTRDRVRDLHPVLSLETPGGVDLHESVTESREFISSRASCSRKVTRSLSHPVEPLHAVSSEFRSDRLNIRQIVDGFVGILSCTLDKTIDLFLAGDPRELQGRAELIRRI